MNTRKTCQVRVKNVAKERLGRTGFGAIVLQGDRLLLVVVGDLLPGVEKVVRSLTDPNPESLLRFRIALNVNGGLGLRLGQCICHPFERLPSREDLARPPGRCHTLALLSSQSNESASQAPVEGRGEKGVTLVASTDR